jgi:glycosyltransferase involved in cell wall biosynthesis
LIAPVESTLTVCIPTRNRSRYLREALVSAFEALGPGLRVVIGDNGDPAPTRALLESLRPVYPAARVSHLLNAEGTTYVQNLQRIVDAVDTEWLVVLHDDDFFVGSPPGRFWEAIARDDCDFIFSDHWVAHADGKIQTEATEANMVHYGRDRLRTGPVLNPALLAVNQAVCLDGFFVRRGLAQAVRFDLRYPVFSDSKWLFLVAERAAGRSYYFQDRWFAYRLSPESLTSRTLDHLEFLRCSVDLNLTDAIANAALRRRQRRLLWPALRQLVRGGKFARIASLALVSVKLVLRPAEPQRLGFLPT